ncbi:MAG: hypothetical protein IJS65_01185 [Clostridia bacterium]|nr:hypothetical protein [Clostridia bacterium]
MKKIVTLISLLLALVLCLAACGEKTAAPVSDNGAKAETNEPAAPAAPDAEEAVPVNESRLAAFYAKYVDDGEYALTLKTEDGDVDIAVKGDKQYIKTKLEGQDMVILDLPDGYFLVSPDAKAAMKMAKTDEAEEEDVFSTDPTGTFVTGEEEINGKSYYYEEYEEEGEKTRFYFDGDLLKYALTPGDTSSMTEFADIRNDVDDSVFEIPSDYEVTDLSALLGDTPAN